MLIKAIKIRLFSSIVLMTLTLLAGESAMSLEQPNYAVIHQEDGVEYRLYDPYLVTETVVANQTAYKSAANEGFRRLFSYITGNNENQSDISMTKPVQQALSSNKIAMTAPVVYDRQDTGYRIAFMLPSKYSLETAPVPLDKRLVTRAIPARTMAALRYSGRWTQSNFLRYQQELIETLNGSEVSTLGNVKSAFYNAPFVPPFLRRNEVMIEVAKMPRSYYQITEAEIAHAY
ncbi:MAG: hypothetical protein ACJA0N_000951 [Pseudohongiellaceae bacterium]|jgi:hypothetical protein